MSNLTVYCTRVRVMVFNVNLNNISEISWQSVLLVEESRVPGKNHSFDVNHFVMVTIVTQFIYRL
jgi:hypothetical protein